MRKRFFLFALLCLSSNCFAQAFDKNLFIGQWECRVKATSPSFGDNFLEKYIADFYPDGTSQVKTVMYSIIDGEPILIKGKFLGRWYVTDNIFSDNTESVLEYSSDNPKLEQRYHFEQMFKTIKSFQHSPILNLSEHRFQVDINDTDFIGVHECKRATRKWQL